MLQVTNQLANLSLITLIN